MVNTGRIACIFTPFALCIASLVCIVIVFLGGWNARSTTLGDYYFFRANVTGLNNVDVVPGTDIDNKIVDALSDAANVKEFYTVYLWNYCSWDGDDKYSFCSERKPYFAFDPAEAFGLDKPGMEDAFPKELRDGLKTYKAVSKWMFVAYVVALVATILELVVGISAIFSRWGSFATTFLASVATLFIFAASITATAMFSVLLGASNKAVEQYGVRSNLGAPMMRTTWLAAVFSLGASCFWLLSVCCCSGRSPYGGAKDSKRVKVEKTPYTYERVGSPYLGPQGGPSHNPGRSEQHVPMSNLPPTKYGESYEPFRPSQV